MQGLLGVRCILLRSAHCVLVWHKFTAVLLSTAPPAQPSVVRESDLQPPKPLWHEDTRGRPHHGGGGRERGEPAGPLAPGAHRMLAASMQLQVSRLNSAPTASPFPLWHSCSLLFLALLITATFQWPSRSAGNAGDAPHKNNLVPLRLAIPQLCRLSMQATANMRLAALQTGGAVAPPPAYANGGHSAPYPAGANPYAPYAPQAPPPAHAGYPAAYPAPAYPPHAHTPPPQQTYTPPPQAYYAPPQVQSHINCVFKDVLLRY